MLCLNTKKYKKFLKSLLKVKIFNNFLKKIAIILSGKTGNFIHSVLKNRSSKAILDVRNIL